MLSADRNRIVWCCPGIPDEDRILASVRARGWIVARRCIDAADVWGAVSIEPDSVVIASTSVQRLEPAIWTEICSSAAAVFVLRSPGDLNPTYAGLGHQEIPADRASDLLVHALATHTPSRTQSHGEGGVVVCVWGTAGAPGRSTIALGLADAWSRAGLRACVIDADTYGPSVAHSLALVEPASGLLLACKHADHGSLNDEALSRALRSIRPGLDILTGLEEASRWPEIRPDSFARVVSECRSHFDVTIVDIHDCIEETSDPVTGMRGERNGVARASLGIADQVIVVARPDPVGVARLVRALTHVERSDSDTQPLVVLNRVRRGVDVTEVKAVLARVGSPMTVAQVPEDSIVSRAAIRGSLLSEMRSRSAARTRLRALARSILAA